MGFDTHIMVVPAGTSTANVPIPHPFIGEMNDKLSDDVKIGGKCCAVKGSKAKHQDSTTHMQMPGTIKFQNNPKCEGEVTNGTSAKVKIDWKDRERPVRAKTFRLTVFGESPRSNDSKGGLSEVSLQPAY